MNNSFVSAGIMAVAAAFSLVGCETAPSAEEEARVVRVLMIGNSFSVSCINQLPAVAENLGVELDLASAYIGGCSLERHWNNVLSNEVAAADGAFRPYDFFRNDRGLITRGRLNVTEALKLARWDFVTIQQASHESWRRESYEPWGGKLIAKIRELAPQAEIVVQETWSYTPFDERLGRWKIDQTGMYERLHAAYAAFARRHGLKTIPFGTAVQQWRRRLPVKYAETSFGGDVVGGGWLAEKDCFVRNGDGSFRPVGDVFHLNAKGEFFQALVWAATLFDSDLSGCACWPEGVTGEDFKLMKDIAVGLR